MCEKVRKYELKFMRTFMREGTKSTLCMQRKICVTPKDNADSFDRLQQSLVISFSVNNTHNSYYSIIHLIENNKIIHCN